MVAGDRDLRSGLVGEPGGVGAVHVAVLAVDRHEREVDSVRGDGLGHALDPAAVAGVIDGVDTVPDHVADRLGGVRVVGGNGPDRPRPEARSSPTSSVASGARPARSAATVSRPPQ